VLTQQVSEPARTFGITLLNPGYITFMFRCEMHFMGVSGSYIFEVVLCQQYIVTGRETVSEFYLRIVLQQDLAGRGISSLSSFITVSLTRSNLFTYNLDRRIFLKAR